MTYTNYTKLILNIKDENIYFYENCLEIVNIKGTDTKVFHSYLTYTPEYCPKCGCVNESHYDIIKWNWKRNCKIKIPKACGFNILLVLDKQRFYVRIAIKHLLLRQMLLASINKYQMILI